MALSTGLPVSRYVSVAVSLTSPAVIAPAMNTLMIIGTSDTIDAAERVRPYANISEVASDFGTTAEEFLAAEAWFAQIPSPDNLLIGRWIDEATPAMLVCGILTGVVSSSWDSGRSLWDAASSEPWDAGAGSILAWQEITDGEFAIAIGTPPVTPINVTGLDFSSDANLNGVASTINAGLSSAGAAATVVWNGQQFIFSTNETGVTAVIGYLTAVDGGSGTDIAEMVKGTVDTAGRLVAGNAPETALSAVATIDALYSSMFYGIVVPSADESEQLDIAAYVEAADPPHYFGVTTGDTRALDPLSEADLASQMAFYGYNKTAVQYSTSNPYAICSYLSRILTTHWHGIDTMITLKYKRQPGVQPENVSTPQADTLRDKYCNVYVGIANGANIIQEGTSASGQFTDTMIGADAFALDIQTSIFNRLYTTNTKIPQTDSGMGVLTNAVAAACATYVQNGFLGPGVWTASGFGNLEQGDMMALGYYVFAPTMGDQSPDDRANRRAPLIQVAAKTSGAVHSADVLIYVNQ